MLECHELLLAKLEETLEQMAFVFASPVEGSPQAPDRCLTGAIEYDGGERGRLELLTGERLGAILAANILAVEPDGDLALQAAQDALKELLNVTCGGVLRERGVPCAPWKMGLPRVERCDAAAWDLRLAETGFEILEAEGVPLAVRWTTVIEA